MSLPQERPGSTGSSNPFSPAPEYSIYLVPGRTILGCSLALCTLPDRFEAHEQGVLLLEQEALLNFGGSLPATASSVGVLAAMRGVMFPKTGTLISPMPSIRTKATLCGMMLYFTYLNRSRQYPARYYLPLALGFSMNCCLNSSHLLE